MLSRKKVFKAKQLCLESTGTKVAKVSDQGQVMICSKVQNPECERMKVQKDEGKESRQGDNEAH